MLVLFILVSHHVTSVSGMFSTHNNTQRICQTEDCRLGQLIASMMDTSIDPCQDMYQFSCGGWLRDNPSYERFVQPSIFNQIAKKITQELYKLLPSNDYFLKCHNSTAIQKLKTLYKVCMDNGTVYAQGTRTLLKLVEDLGSWTLTSAPGGWNKTNWSLQHALERSHYLWGTSFWSTNITIDYKNASRYILYIKQDGIRDPSVYNDFVKDTLIGEDWSYAARLGGEDILLRKIEEVFELEKNLSKKFVNRSELERNRLNSYNKMTVREFQNLLGSWINIQQYFSAIAGRSFLTEEDEIIVETPKYFEKLKDIIQGTDAEVLANYIVLNFIRPAHNYVPAKPNEVAESPCKVKYRSESRCLDIISQMMMFAISALYVENHFSTQLTSKVAVILDDIEHQFIEVIENQNWIDLQAKTQIVAKIRSLTNHIGFPDWVNDPQKLDKEYEDLKVVETDFLENFVRVTRFDFEKKITKYRETPQIPWYTYPLTASARYEDSYNELTVYAGLLQEPLVSQSYPEAYMYGSIGRILAHELFYSYESLGKLVDVFDKQLKWEIATEIFQEFKNISQCLVDQFNSYSYRGNKLDGFISLGENIVDEGSLKISYRAFKNAFKPKHTLPYLNLTEEQLFFVGNAQTFCSHYSNQWLQTFLPFSAHTISKFRVIGSMSNSEDFARAFKCHSGAASNPENKCEVWRRLET